MQWLLENSPKKIEIMPIIRLPDGSERSFDAPVTIAEVAASIGAGIVIEPVAGGCAGYPLCGLSG